MLIVVTANLFSSCMIFPARVVMPLKTKVVDSESSEPVIGAKVLRIVCDIHNHDCSNAKIDYGVTDKNGLVIMNGDRKWGLYILAPGGLPAPNHNIAIWKNGYYAFVFSQYGKIEDILRFAKRKDLFDAIKDIPLERYGYNYNPYEMFLDGQVKLYKRKNNP